jgi:hypothetical protein
MAQLYLHNRVFDIRVLHVHAHLELVHREPRTLHAQYATQDRTILVVDHLCVLPCLPL